MPRPPNYKQEKKRREDERRKRNALAEQHKLAKKTSPVASSEATAKPEVP